LVHAIRIPSTSLSQATEMQRELETRLRQVPEVAFVFSRTGTADLAGDPMPPYISDTFVMLKPRAEWPRPADVKEDVRRRIDEILQRVPGNSYEFTPPIQMRFNELLAGVRSDVSVKIFGDELEAIVPIARRVAGVLRNVEGAADTRVEQIDGAPVLSIDVDRDISARYGLNLADVHDVIAVGVGGRRAGEIFQGDKRFDVVVRLADQFRQDPAALAGLPVLLPHVDPIPSQRRLVLAAEDVPPSPSRIVPLSAVASITATEGPNQISRENGKRRVVVQANVRGRDIGSFVEDARARLEEEVMLPPGSWVVWGGQFENLEKAKARLFVIVPICLGGIVLLLYATFGSLPQALMIFTGVPLALTGGVFSLWLRDMPFSISAAVGFIALSGVAVLNGLVLLTFIRELHLGGMPVRDAVIGGATTRLRPILMTALVASLGFLPMALATGTGAEVQRPLATVVIGGLVSSTLLTLFVLPVLYDLFSRPLAPLPAAGRGAKGDKARRRAETPMP
jgi:cobalt-zinc-cadmium resistance protein CzcA